MREGWVQTTLGEMAKLLKERNNSKKLVRVMTVSAADGLVDQEKYFKKSVASSNLANYRVVDPGDFVYNKSTSKDAPMGVITQWNGDDSVLVSPIYLVFRTESDTSIDSYLKHYFKSGRFFASLQGMLREGARAHGALNVRQDEFLSAELVLPPLQEQRRIVDLMDSVDDAISAAQAELDAGAHLRDRLLDHELGNPADDWEQTTLGEIAVWHSGATPKATNRSFYEGGNIPWAKIGDVNNGEITSTEVMITDSGLREIGRTAPVGSVLVTMYGSIGRSALVKREMATNQAIAWGVPNQSVSSEFLFLLMKSSEKRFDSLGRGATQRNINRKIVKDLTIHLPPQAEQQRIVAKMAALDSAVTAAGTALDRLRELRSSMLTVLLSGEHEIPETYDQFLTEAGEA